MRPRNLPDRHETIYLTIVVACLLGILILCWGA